MTILPKLYFKDDYNKLRSVEVDVTEEAPDLMENTLEHCGSAKDAKELSDQIGINITSAVVAIIDCEGDSKNNHLKIVE